MISLSQATALKQLGVRSSHQRSVSALDRTGHVNGRTNQTSHNVAGLARGRDKSSLCGANSEEEEPEEGKGNVSVATEEREHAAAQVALGAKL